MQFQKSSHRALLLLLVFSFLPSYQALPPDLILRAVDDIHTSVAFIQRTASSFPAAKRLGITSDATILSSSGRLEAVDDAAVDNVMDNHVAVDSTSAGETNFTNLHRSMTLAFYSKARRKAQITRGSSASMRTVVSTISLQITVVLCIFAIVRCSSSLDGPSAKEVTYAKQDLQSRLVSSVDDEVDAISDNLLNQAESFNQILHAKASRLNQSTFARVWSIERGLESSLSHLDFARAAASGASALRVAGITKGDRVALLCKGTLDFFVAVLSIQALGATPVLLNWRQSEENLRGSIIDTGAKVLILGFAFYELGCKLADASSSVGHVLLLNDTAFGSTKTQTSAGKQMCTWSWDLSGDINELLRTRCSRQDEALVFFTSGSTSRPKPVVHTYETLLWLAQHFRLPRTASSTLSFMPNFHVIMTVQNFLVPLARDIGVSIHGADATASISSRMLLAACKSLRPTIVDTVPFIMTEWSELPPSELEPLTSCVWVQSGGAPLPSVVAERLIAAGIKAREHYGQTECPGKQLVSIQGALPSELSIFQPPWSCSHVELLGDEVEGELLISGTSDSSPGYLSEPGNLIPGSSRKDSNGRHHTGDIFRWVTATNGVRGLKHCMRTDDMLLLSTGEMFNPVPMEMCVMSEAMKAGVQVSHTVVLGQRRASPFFVAQLADSDPRSPSDISAVLETALEHAGEHEPEYARIKAGHLLVLKPLAGDLSLPTSAKGNVIRKQAEELLAARLDELTQAFKSASSQAIDWEVVQAEANAAGYEDIERYLLGPGSKRIALMGIDSLGITSAITSATLEADRVTDNIKAWMIGTVMMAHWYQSLWDEARYSPNTTNPYLLTAERMVLTSELTVDCIVEFGAPMFCLLLAIGWAESAREGDGSTEQLQFFNSRTKMLLTLLFLRKLVFTPLLLLTLTSHPGSMEMTNNFWFWYVPIYGKALVMLLSRFNISRFLKVLISFLPALGVFLAAAYVQSLRYTGWWVEDGPPDFTVSGFEVAYPVKPSFLLGICRILFDPYSFVNFRDVTYSIDGVDLPSSFCLPSDGSSSIVLATMTRSSPDSCLFLDIHVFSYIAPYVLGFFYGPHIGNMCKRVVSFLTARAIASGVPRPEESLRMGLASILTTLLVTLHVLYQLCGRTFGAPVGAVQALWTFSGLLLLSALVVLICALFPGHAKRTGSSALGLYFFNIFWPALTFEWVISGARSLSGFYSHNAAFSSSLVGLQFVMLFAWPYLYDYLLGPLLQQVIEAVILLSGWLARLFYEPVAAVLDAMFWIRNLPLAVASWTWKFLRDTLEALLALPSLFLWFLITLAKAPVVLAAVITG